MTKYYGETESGYPRQATDDKDGEYSYIWTPCQNFWYSVVKDPMYRDGCICPKCGKTVRVIMEDRCEKMS